MGERGLMAYTPVALTDARYVNVTGGDTMAMPFTVSPGASFDSGGGWSYLTLGSSNVAGGQEVIFFGADQTAAGKRFALYDDRTADRLIVSAYSLTGVHQGNPMTLDRASFGAVFSGNISIVKTSPQLVLSGSGNPGIYQTEQDTFLWFTGGAVKIMNGAGSAFKLLYASQIQSAYPVNAGNWQNTNFVADSAGNTTGVAFYTSGYGIAPFVRNYGPYGERIDFMNSANTAYIPICASAFSAQPSSREAKQEIERVEDHDLVRRIGGLRTHTFRRRVRPQVMRKDKRGEMVKDVFHDHDCDIDGCKGTRENPCPVIANDGPKIGLIAEDVHEVAPEAVFYDEDNKPAGYDVDAIAALALGGVGALLRKIEELTARVEQLEGLLA